MDCCPLVIDPLTLTALLAFIAAATYFLWGWNMTLYVDIQGISQYFLKVLIAKYSIPH